MSWSLRIGRFAGITVYIHFTFFILLFVLAGLFYANDPNPMAVIRGVGFILLLFLCITLHEFGHALTARHFNVRTRDITLLPIGGLARLEDMPKEPMHEFWIAIAGPAVNVVIAILLAPVVFILSQSTPLTTGDMGTASLLGSLLLANIILVAFNMLPAFPMDGGRVLRAVLAMNMDFVKATAIASRIGQAMAIGFILLSFPLNNLWLIFIGLFVWIGASGEAQAAKFHIAVEGATAREAMLTDFRSITPQTTLAEVVNFVMAGSQEDFPVIDEEGKLVGILLQREFLEGLTQRGRNSLTIETMRREFPTVAPETEVEDVMQRGQFGEMRSVPVLEDGHFIGLLTLQNVNELVMIRTAIRQRELLKKKDVQNMEEHAMRPHTPQ